MDVHWFALKVFYNKVFDVEDILDGRGLETFIPVTKEQLKGEEFFRVKRRLAVPDDSRNDRKYIVEGPYIFKRKTIVASLLFFRGTLQDALQVRADFEGRAMLYTTVDRKAPAIIPDSQMKMFRMVCESGMDGLEFFSDENIVNFKQGDRVRVTMEGPLKGVEGYIKRIKKDRRLLVAIEGFVAVATAFIPPKYLEKVDQSPA
ncbi:MAG: transcriptional regulator [Bacteroidales bacterium]|nr:transcriptional regulator [Bacteroidales bacterium]